MKVLNYFPILALAALTCTSSCKKDKKTPEEETPTPSSPAYTVPTSYNFTNADFTSSTRRISMLGEMTTYIRSTHTSTLISQPSLNAQKLKDMYANVNNLFTGVDLNTSGVQLKDQTSNAFSFQSVLEANFVDAADASVIAAANPTTSTASNGVKGKIISPARAILVDANGFEYKEFAEKGIMGAVFYHKATTILTNIGSYDNTSLVNGATAQEKAWDEAFGYFGVPIAFPTNTVGLKYWGTYANSVNAAINCNTTIMDAFLKGRAAISNKDNEGRDVARTVVINTWEKAAAAKCINYLKGAKNNITDAGTLHHNLSEGYGFVTAFRYNPSKTISDADISLLLSYFGNNLYVITQTNIENAINKLAAVFSLDASKL
jgi:hypothetical protein